MFTFYTMFLYKAYTTLNVEKGALGSLQRCDVVIIIIKLEPSVPGDFWAQLVKILVFPSPTGSMLPSFGLFVLLKWLIFYKFSLNDGYSNYDI